MICLSSFDCLMHITLQISGIVQHLFTLFSSFLICTFLLFPSVFYVAVLMVKWSSYRHYIVQSVLLIAMCIILQ